MNLLETKHIVKKYAEHTALNDVSIAVPEGVIYGMLGPNGAGKTSLIRIINQITGPDSGEVLFAGERLQQKHIPQIGYLPEERGLYKKMKVGEQLLYLAQLKGLSKNDAMEKLKEWFIKFDIKPWWNKTIDDLSKGMAQKIQFVATVMHEPKLIILDEPFTGFDPINANLIKDEILELRKKGSTIIFSTHRMESVEELCDHIALINKSRKVLDGSKKEIKEQFKTNTFSVASIGAIQTLPEQFQFISSVQKEDNEFISQIKINQGSVNSLMQELINHNQIKSLIENIPSMNDIFIKVVGDDQVNYDTIQK